MSATRILSLSLSSYLFLHRWSQFPTIFSRIKDTWIATIEFPIEMPINDLFFFNSSNRVFRNVSYAKCLKCTSFLSRPMLQNFQRFHFWATCKFHDTDERKKKTVRSMCVLNPNSFCSMKIYHLCPMITIEHTQTILNIYRYIYIREFSIAFSEPLFTGMPSFVFVLFFQCHLKSRLSVLLAI